MTFAIGFCQVKKSYKLLCRLYCTYLWTRVLVLEKPSSSFELVTEKLKSAKQELIVHGRWQVLALFISFIIIENLGKVSAFVVRKLRPLKLLRSMVLGLSCRNICSLFYLKNENKLYTYYVYCLTVHFELTFFISCSNSIKKAKWKLLR